MNRQLTILYYATVLIISCISISSCVNFPINDPYIVDEGRQKENIYYVPSAPITPLSTEKNDIGFNLMHSSASKFDGTEIQASWLPSSHIGIVAGYSFANNNGAENYMKSKRFEFGAGYVRQMGDGWHIEAYAGAGSGKVENRHYTGYSRVDLIHGFVQPAIAVSDAKKNFTLAFVSRFTGVHFAVKDTLFNTDREPLNITQLKDLYDRPFHIMWEPGLILRGGWRNCRVHLGFSFSSDITNPDLQRATSNFSIGAAFSFNTTRKK